MEGRNYTKEERFDAGRVEALKHHYAEILRLLGEDPAREGLLKTPERVAKAMAFLTKGYDEDPLEIIRSATFREEYRQMVLVKDIELYSLCEHHMLPFYGKAHVAYIPNGRITGLSHPGGARPDGRGRGDRGQPHVHADARHRETAVGHHDLGLHGRLPLEPAHPRGVHDAHLAPVPVTRPEPNHTEARNILRAFSVCRMNPAREGRCGEVPAAMREDTAPRRQGTAREGRI